MVAAAVRKGHPRTYSQQICKIYSSSGKFVNMGFHSRHRLPSGKIMFIA
jgi:hypothetical protein